MTSADDVSTAIDVLQELKEMFDDRGPEYADVSQTLYYLETRNHELVDE